MSTRPFPTVRIPPQFFDSDSARITMITNEDCHGLGSTASGQMGWPNYLRRSLTRKSLDGRASMGEKPRSNSDPGFNEQDTHRHSHDGD